MGLKRACNSNLKLHIPERGVNRELNGNKMEIGSSLKEAMLSAKEQGRITYGVYESAKLLEIHPDSVMLCVLPENDFADVTLHIHYTLLEAFCIENDIRVMKVDSEEKLAKLLGENSSDVNDNDLQFGRRPASTTDFNCILIEYPTEGTTESEEDVVEYYKTMSEVFPKPIIELPV